VACLMVLVLRRSSPLFDVVLLWLFASAVGLEDGWACEVNQRLGLRLGRDYLSRRDETRSRALVS
jgi:hypothetical protein